MRSCVALSHQPPCVAYLLIVALSGCHLRCLGRSAIFPEAKDTNWLALSGIALPVFSTLTSSIFVPSQVSRIARRPRHEHTSALMRATASSFDRFREFCGDVSKDAGK